MQILLIGGGGREHALAWKLAQSQKVTRITCAPGNAGIARETVSKTGEKIDCRAVKATDLEGILGLAKDIQPDLCVVAPDDPLALGMVDHLTERGFRAWGPTKKAARFEWSKGFSQEFMAKHGIPTAKSKVCQTAAEAVDFANELQGHCAVKADGLALGKGVIVCHSTTEAHSAIKSMMEDSQFGEAGKNVVIQERLEGLEMSIHALCDGRTWKLFPSAQDHKPAFDGDKGPNTGGMGTFTPAPFLQPEEFENVAKLILDPWLKGCKKEGIEYKGLLYPGIMMTADGPKVIEFNSRFGDPETQCYLPQLENDIVELMEACIDGSLEKVELKWKRSATVCVVIASGGYPGQYEKGKEITGIESAEALGEVKVFHAGTKIDCGKLLTSGGRVLGVAATADNLKMAQERAYKAVEKISFENCYYRTDIADKALKS